ncbi:UDP-3-O-(3-hydroxymyristoyl)glucosamine N-acyltransferase [Nonlabens sp. MB-3u-79]|uniref:UDP-3-O-(3-hydroxymyristoyl)glucosamine N-acyltransferase n=1 Tax=Nonlabens sp. MB-3u-79 TaxID=2058134 RepID=UPI000C30703A|nr:UDP-3-O-(3-hydroxymyristoyl)glucosamine N-acyltransferase [Nonlabens sp. MB-3u-79]AUC80100.1 UDP-3-O-(3-hydroxymyristoyl)glucosamine N-acyltransferase [Nonlabens sp. MB-3u-79]|tara:strand:- start:8152 stop:9141 length:990 start_codon:yes stop_codon:yes gene_type:complete
MHSFTVQQINDILQGELVGNTTHTITGVEEIRNASPTDLTFIGNKKYAKFWVDSKASVAIINDTIVLEPGSNRAFIKVKNADLAMAMLLEAFQPPAPVFDTAIHPTAVIHETARIGDGVQIGAHCYIGKNVVLGDGVILYHNVSVFDDTTIGAQTIAWSGTVIRERSQIGAQCIFHNNVSIGADGFGYRPADDGRGLVKIPHIGNVVIGNGVEIGANSCVDRAKFNSTIIGDGCKIDNLVQIAHNCIMGRSCIMAGHSGLAGSVTLGDGVIIGGSASIKDHTTIGSGATVGAGSGVLNDVKEGQTVLGYPAADSRNMLKQWVALRRLAK